MADLFVDDGGSNTSPYETWAKAATSFATAVSAASAGDRIIIGHDHSETIGSVTYAFPGIISSPNEMISALSTAGGSTVTYTKAGNIQISVTSDASQDLSITGYVKFFGVSIRVADNFTTSGSGSLVDFDDSVLEIGSGQSGQWQMGGIEQNLIRLKNTDVNFSFGTGFFACGNNTDFVWEGGTLSLGGQPTALFDDFSRMAQVNVMGVDLSALTSALLDISESAKIEARFRHCLLNSGVALSTGAIGARSSRILMSGCDDTTGNDLYRLEYIDYWGSTVHDDTIFRDGGASDGATRISWKMVSTANAAEFSEPTKSPPVVAWVDSIGSKTFTVHLVFDGVTDLDDDEVWLELEYLEASADTDSAFADDRSADITATPAAQATSTETWIGTGGFTNENKQQLDVAVTVNRVGPIIARVCLAKPSTTIYVDPKLELT